MSLQRPKHSSGQTGGSGPMELEDGLFFKSTPTLAEFILSNVWPGTEERRERGSMTIFADEGRLKCCLSCKDTSRVAFVSASGLQDLLKAADRGLEADKLDWRPARKQQKGKAS